MEDRVISYFVSELLEQGGGSVEMEVDADELEADVGASHVADQCNSLMLHTNKNRPRFE